MINNEKTRDELKAICRDVYAIGDRLRELSKNVSLEENSKDGDELFNIGSHIASQILNIAIVGRFRMEIRGKEMAFKEWDDED